MIRVRVCWLRHCGFSGWQSSGRVKKQDAFIFSQNRMEYIGRPAQ